MAVRRVIVRINVYNNKITFLALGDKSYTISTHVKNLSRHKQIKKELGLFES